MLVAEEDAMLAAEEVDVVENTVVVVVASSI